jgi:hypothetical protein
LEGGQVVFREVFAGISMERLLKKNLFLLAKIKKTSGIKQNAQ